MNNGSKFLHATQLIMKGVTKYYNINQIDQEN